MDLHYIAITHKPWRVAAPLVVAATMAATVTAAWAGGGTAAPPIAAAELQASDIRHMLESLQPLRSLWHKAYSYSFCGACTDDSACGSGNKCCTGDCSGNQKKCYAVATCADAK